MGNFTIMNLEKKLRTMNKDFRRASMISKRETQHSTLIKYQKGIPNRHNDIKGASRYYCTYTGIENGRRSIASSFSYIMISSRFCFIYLKDGKTMELDSHSVCFRVKGFRESIKHICVCIYTR